jgi:hypothetical protein
VSDFHKPQNNFQIITHHDTEEVSITNCRLINRSRKREESGGNLLAGNGLKQAWLTVGKQKVPFGQSTTAVKILVDTQSIARNRL